MKFRCPDCGYTERFWIDVTANCIYYNEEDAYRHFKEVEPQIDDTSETLQCCACGRAGTYAEFSYEKPEVNGALLDRFKKAWTNMKGTFYKVGDTFRVFGVKYKVCHGADCEECAFFNGGCDINPSIPSCNTDIHFEIVKED